MQNQDVYLGWTTAFADMMADTNDAREGAPPLPPDDAVDVDKFDLRTRLPMRLSPKVAKWHAEDEAWRMARKRFLVRQEDEIWRAGYLTGWHIHEVPRDDVEQPEEPVKPMEALFQLRVGDHAFHTTTDFTGAAHRFHAIADNFRLADEQTLINILGVEV